jgi:hypothetical protein
MNLQKILAENMLRFGAKNLSESDISHIQRLMEAETSFSYVYASTTSETIGNTTMMADGVNAAGLMAPDATTYPDAGLVVFSTTVPALLGSAKSKRLSSFTPVRTTTKAMDVLKIGSKGGDFAAGASSGKIEFSATSTDTIEASHNGLLVLARLVETYIDAGKPADATLIVEMGAADRYGSYINLAGLDKLDINKSYKGEWSSWISAALVPDGGFAANVHYAPSFDGKTAAQRATTLNNMFGKGAFDKTMHNSPMAMSGVPKIDSSKLTLLNLDFTDFVTTYLGKLDDPALETRYDNIWKTVRTNWITNVNKILAQYSKEFPTAITSDKVKTIIANCEKADPGTITSKAYPIMNNPAGPPGEEVPGTKVKPKTDSGTYELGKSKN